MKRITRARTRGGCSAAPLQIPGLREPDLVAEAATVDGDSELVVVHVDVEGAFRNVMDQRMMEYAMHLVIKTGKPVVSIAVFLTGGPRGIKVREVNKEGAGWTTFRFFYLAFGLSGSLAEEFVDRPQPLNSLIIQPNHRLVTGSIGGNPRGSSISVRKATAVLRLRSLPDEARGLSERLPKLADTVRAPFVRGPKARDGLRTPFSFLSRPADDLPDADFRDPRPDDDVRTLISEIHGPPTTSERPFPVFQGPATKVWPDCRRSAGVRQS